MYNQHELVTTFVIRIILADSSYEDYYHSFIFVVGTFYHIIVKINNFRRKVINRIVLGLEEILNTVRCLLADYRIAIVFNNTSRQKYISRNFGVLIYNA